MKSKLKFTSKDTNAIRDNFRQYYINKFFSLFMGAYEWTGLDDQERDYLMRRLWADGRISITKLKSNGVEINNEEHPNGVLILAKFVPTEWNLYDFATKLTMVNNRGSKYVPTDELEVNKDVVIGYAQRNHKSVFSCIEPKLDELVDVEMTIRTNLKLHKIPFVIGVTPESKMKMSDVWDNIMDDQPSLFMDLEDVKNITSLQTGTPYVIDKLLTYKKEIIDDILTILGVDNLGIAEKHEQLRVDEINSNNDIINDHSSVYLDAMLEMCKLVKDVLGYDMTVKATSTPVTATREEGEEQEEDNDYEIN